MIRNDLKASDPVAAPDHKIRKCIQRSALFPGRADGKAREPRSTRAPRVWGVGRGAVAHGVWRLAPRKIFKKSTLKSRIFCIFVN